MGADPVVDVGEQGDLDSERVAVTDQPAVEVLVFEGAEEPLDNAVGLRAADSGSDVAQQRVVAVESCLERLPAEARTVVGDQRDRCWDGPQVGAVVVEQVDAAPVGA